MARRPPTTEIHIVLRTILIAGVLAVLVRACAGATGLWTILAARVWTIRAYRRLSDAASDGATIEVQSGTHEENTQKNQKCDTV